MRPKAIFVEEPASDGTPRYRIVFDGDGGKQIEHIFTINSAGGIDGVKYTNEYFKQMPPEPFTKWLCESLILLHRAIGVLK